MYNDSDERKQLAPPMSTQSVRSTGETDALRRCLSCGKESLRDALDAAMRMTASLWVARTGRPLEDIIALMNGPSCCSMTFFERGYVVGQDQNCVFCRKPTNTICGVLIDINNRRIVGGADKICCEMAAMTRQVASIAKLVDQLSETNGDDVKSIGDRLLEQVEVCTELSQKVRRQNIEFVQ